MAGHFNYRVSYWSEAREEGIDGDNLLLNNETAKRSCLPPVDQPARRQWGINIRDNCRQSQYLSTTTFAITTISCERDCWSATINRLSGNDCLMNFRTLSNISALLSSSVERRRICQRCFGSCIFNVWIERCDT